MVGKAEIRQLTALHGVAAMLVVMHHFKKEFGRRSISIIITTRLVSSRPLYSLGVISYSIYLDHALVQRHGNSSGINTRPTISTRLRRSLRWSVCWG
jgi:peptidoglycan/LPS O-acetylase OafA/YrhL